MLKVTSIRYFETRRGVGYECKTNNKDVSIWNDGNGGGTYIDVRLMRINKACSSLISKYERLSESCLESLIDNYEFKKS